MWLFSHSFIHLFTFIQKMEWDNGKKLHSEGAIWCKIGLGWGYSPEDKIMPGAAVGSGWKRRRKRNFKSNILLEERKIFGDCYKGENYFLLLLCEVNKIERENTSFTF